MPRNARRRYFDIARVWPIVAGAATTASLLAVWITYRTQAGLPGLSDDLKVVAIQFLLYESAGVGLSVRLWHYGLEVTDDGVTITNAMFRRSFDWSEFVDLTFDEHRPRVCVEGRSGARMCLRVSRKRGRQEFACASNAIASGRQRTRRP